MMTFLRRCNRLQNIDNEEVASLFGNQYSKRQSATELVMDSIKKGLVKKTLKPGDKLPSETELAEALHVSRGSIREAMKILSAYGIVEVKRGDGTYISNTSEGSIFDPLMFKLIIGQSTFGELKELREMIEIGIIRLAIENAGEEDISDLEESYDFAKNMIQEGKYEDDVIVKAELMFHTALGRATKNKLVQIVYNYVMDLYIPNIYKDKSDEKFGDEALSTHRPIIDAIINKDIEGGEEAIKYSMQIWKDQASRIKRMNE